MKAIGEEAMNTICNAKCGCKHAVAVALSTVEQQLWEAFWGLPEDEDVPQRSEHLTGRFQFQLFWPEGNHPAKGLEIRAIDRDNDVLVSSPERMLKQAITQWHAVAGGQEMPRALKLELGIFQFLLQKGGKPSHRGQGWWFIPLAMVNDAIYPPLKGIAWRLQALRSI